MVAGPLAEALERGRKLYNAKFALARRMNRRLDPDKFSRHMISAVDPIVRSAARVNPGLVDGVVEALFDLSLELVAREYLGPGARYPLMDAAWHDLLPRIPHLMIKAPYRLAASISNGVYNLCEEKSADPRGWIDLMIACGQDCSSVESFLELGQAAAWRFGLAHFREGALAIWNNLPEKLKLAVLGLPENTRLENDAWSDLLADPWRPPSLLGRGGGTKKLDLAAIVGGFRGFGGPFIRPPQVTVVDGRIFAFDSEFCWSVHADFFGATLKRFGRDVPSGAGAEKSEFSVNKDGVVQNGQLAARFPFLADYTSYTSANGALAVTVRRSHRVFILAVRDYDENPG